MVKQFLIATKSVVPILTSRDNYNGSIFDPINLVISSPFDRALPANIDSLHIFDGIDLDTFLILLKQVYKYKNYTKVAQLKIIFYINSGKGYDIQSKEYNILIEHIDNWIKVYQKMKVQYTPVILDKSSKLYPLE